MILFFVKWELSKTQSDACILEIMQVLWVCFNIHRCNEEQREGFWYGVWPFIYVLGFLSAFVIPMDESAHVCMGTAQIQVDLLSSSSFVSWKSKYLYKINVYCVHISICCWLYKSNLWVAAYHYIYIYIYIPEEQSYSFHRPLEGHNLAIFQDLKRKHDFFCEGVDKLQGVGWGLPLGRRWSLKSQCSSSRCAGHGPGFLGHHWSLDTELSASPRRLDNISRKAMRCLFWGAVWSSTPTNIDVENPPFVDHFSKENMGFPHRCCLSFSD